MISAMQIRADYLLTRNPRDFQPPPLPVIQPSELLVILTQTQ